MAVHELVDSAVWLANAFVGLALAGLVLAATPRRTPHLALVAFLLAAAANAVAGVLADNVATPWLAFNARFYGVLSLLGLSAFYAIFIGAAIPSPLARPLRARPVRVAILLALAATAVLAFRAPSLFVEGTTLPFRPGALVARVWLVNAIILVWALVASLDAFRRAAPGSVARARARTYAIAFGVQDTSVLLSYAVEIVGGPGMELSAGLILAAGAATAWLLVARAMIRDHLFDADLRLKRGIARGTVAATFVAVFFVVAQVAQEFLSDAYGYLVGGAAAGILVFALQPLQRMADTVSRTAMPRVEDTEEYRLVRKREVYRAALESAMEDGDVTEKERGMLATLASQLGLDPREAFDIERAARGGAAR